MVLTATLTRELEIKHNYLRVIVNNLNKKLKPHAELVGIYGTGYVLKVR